MSGLIGIATSYCLTFPNFLINKRGFLDFEKM